MTGALWRLKVTWTNLEQVIQSLVMNMPAEGLRSLIKRKVMYVRRLKKTSVMHCIYLFMCNG